MNFFLDRKNVFILLGGLSLVAVILVVIAASSLQQPPPQTTLVPTPPLSVEETTTTPYPTSFYSKQYNDEAKKINREQDLVLQQGIAVTKFEDSLPHQGAFFSATYKISTNTVTVVFVKEKAQEANLELDTYLKKFGVENRSWIQNLVVQ